MNHHLKRQNFNVDADQAAVLETARANLNAPNIKDAMIRAARLVNTLANELHSGNRLAVLDKEGRPTRLVLPDFDVPSTSWIYLCERPHPWRRQLYVKGRKLLASTVWNDLIANQMTAEEAAEDRDLPVDAVLEIIRYCNQNLSLIQMEAQEEKTRLLGSGVALSG
jgi:hypothetical protein